MIDLHAHVVLESALGAAGPHGPELDEGDPATGRLPCFRVGDYRLIGVDYRGSPFMDPGARLAAMDAAGVVAETEHDAPAAMRESHHVRDSLRRRRGEHERRSDALRMRAALHVV